MNEAPYITSWNEMWEDNDHKLPVNTRVNAPLSAINCAERSIDVYLLVICDHYLPTSHSLLYCVS